MNLERLEYYSEYFNRQKDRKYSCSICAIITNDRNKAINLMKNKKIVKKIEREDYAAWLLDNEEQWIWQRWDKHYLGRRFYKVIVDKNITDEVFDLLVLPCAACFCCSMEII